MGLLEVRNLDNNDLSFKELEDPHWNSQAISGALWDIRQDLGNYSTDRLAFEALKVEPKARNFSDYGYNLIVVDNALYARAHESTIRTYFANHGITIRTFTPDPLSVSLSGTMTLDNVNDWGDWTAQAMNPPDPTITYQWWLCPFAWAECQYMESHTTTDVYDHYIGYPVSGEDFYVKVIATSGGQTAEATHEVDILDNGMSLASAAAKDSTSAATGTQMKAGNGAARAGLTTLAAGEPLPEKVELGDNYPNPFSRSTTIEFALPEPAEVHLLVFDVMGREVARPAVGQYGAGRHRVTVDASHLPSGTYFYRLTTGDFSRTKRMVVLR